jgi:hypothetical protein
MPAFFRWAFGGRGGAPAGAARPPRALLRALVLSTLNLAAAFAILAAGWSVCRYRVWLRVGPAPPDTVPGPPRAWLLWDAFHARAAVCREVLLAGYRDSWGHFNLPVAAAGRLREEGLESLDGEDISAELVEEHTDVVYIKPSYVQRRGAPAERRGLYVTATARDPALSKTLALAVFDASIPFANACEERLRAQFLAEVRSHVADDDWHYFEAQRAAHAWGYDLRFRGCLWGHEDIDGATIEVLHPYAPAAGAVAGVWVLGAAALAARRARRRSSTPAPAPPS